MACNRPEPTLTIRWQDPRRGRPLQACAATAWEGRELTSLNPFRCVRGDRRGSLIATPDHAARQTDNHLPGETTCRGTNSDGKGGPADALAHGVPVHLCWGRAGSSISRSASRSPPRPGHAWLSPLRAGGMVPIVLGHGQALRAAPGAAPTQVYNATYPYSGRTWADTGRTWSEPVAQR